MTTYSLRPSGSYLLYAIRRLIGLRSACDLTAVDPIVATAQKCAASRAVETTRGPDALIHDPLAIILSDKQFHIYRRRDDLGPRIVIRTKYFDEFASAHLSTCSQLVLVGAGMDTRAYRLESLNPTHTVFEIDHQAVLAAKESLLERVVPPVHPRCKVVRVVGNACENQWMQRLVHAGYDTSVSSVWLLEGLLYYLTEDQVSTFLRNVRSLCAPASWLCFSAVTALRVNRVGHFQRLFKSACPEPQVCVENAGFVFHRVDELGGPNANYGRWPGPRIRKLPSFVEDRRSEQRIADSRPANPKTIYVQFYVGHD